MAFMRVLLISPLDPQTPTKLKFLMGGENTYTRSFLQNPPKGVEYVHFAKALKSGQIKYSFWQKPLNWLIKLRILPLSPKMYCFEIKDHFDLIHSHVHSIKLSGLKTPVVLSDSSSNILFLKDYLGWSKLRIKLGYLLKKWVVKLLDIYDSELNLKDTNLMVWSQFAKRVHQSFGEVPSGTSGKITVIPPGISLPNFKNQNHSQFNILFIGIWFERKGGPLVLEAFKKLKRKYPQIILTIIGQVPHNKLPQGVLYKDYLPRKELIKRIYPKASVLVLAPPQVEGYGLVVLEAASFGIPAIISSICALPELVEDGKTGLIVKPGSVFELTKALETLINNPNLFTRIGKAAKRRFLKKFWVEVTNKKLLEVYHQVIRS